MTTADQPGLWVDRRERLALFLQIDAAVAFASAAFLLAVELTVSTTRWVALLAACVALVGVALVIGLVVLRRGRLLAALTILAAANWGIALIAAAIAPFALPVLVIIALLPAALAVPFVDRRQLRRFVIATIVVATAVVALGGLQDATRIEDDLPGWVPTLVTVLFTPVMASLIAVIVYQMIDALSAALDEAIDNRDELVHTQARLVTAADEARRRIERDLHDGAQQRLTALAIGLGRVHARAAREGMAIEPDIDALRVHLADARGELRRLAHGLYPSALAIDGLESALRGEADRFALPISVRCDALPDAPLAVQAAVYFCCLEALHNATRHGSPSTVAITVSAVEVSAATTEGAALVRFRVVDDGAGFDPKTATDGHGFANMRDRVGAFGGLLLITSTPGQGCTVTGEIPLRIL